MHPMYRAKYKESKMSNLRAAVLIGLLLLISGIEPHPGPRGASDNQSKSNQDFKAILEGIHSKLERIDDLDNKMDTLNRTVKGMETWQEGISDSMTRIMEENKELREAVNKLTEENRQLQKQTSDMQEKLIDHESRSRRNNLLFYGVPRGSGHETWEQAEKKVKKVISEGLKLNGDDIEVNRAHRIPNGAIIVNLLRFKDKEAILRAKGKLKDTDVSIGEDYPKEIRDVRRKLWQLTKTHRDNNQRVIVKYDKVQIDNQLYMLNPEDRLVPVRSPNNARPKTRSED